MYSKNNIPPPSPCMSCKKDRYRLPNGRPRCAECDSKRAKSYHGKKSDSHKNRVKSYYYNNKDKYKDYANRNRVKIRDEARVRRTPEYIQRLRDKAHPSYGIWSGMKSRCLSPTSPAFHHYGGRGITICDRWKNSFDTFAADMGPRPEPHYKYSIDRINNNGNYEPGNCRWATQKTQVNNTRKAMVRRTGVPDDCIIHHKGVLVTLGEFIKTTTLPDGVVRYRYFQRKDEDWILSPESDRRWYKWQGHTMNLDELSLMSGIRYEILADRIRIKKWSVDKAMTTLVS